MHLYVPFLTTDTTLCFQIGLSILYNTLIGVIEPNMFHFLLQLGFAVECNLIEMIDGCIE